MFVQGATGPIVWGVADPINGPSRERAEEAASICIAASRRHRGGSPRTRTNEPVVIHSSSFGEGKGGCWMETNELAVVHRSSFGEGKGGGLDSFILVPT